MTGCGCSNKPTEIKEKCPLCHSESDYVNYRVVETVVKEDVRSIVLEDKYYTCTNDDCDVVFFNADAEQIFLTIDVDLTADFNEVTKKKKSCGGSCGGCGKH